MGRCKRLLAIAYRIQRNGLGNCGVQGLPTCSCSTYLCSLQLTPSQNSLTPLNIPCLRNEISPMSSFLLPSLLPPFLPFSSVPLSFERTSHVARLALNHHPLCWITAMPCDTRHVPTVSYPTTQVSKQKYQSSKVKPCYVPTKPET